MTETDNDKVEGEFRAPMVLETEDAQDKLNSNRSNLSMPGIKTSRSNVDIGEKF